MGAAQHTRPQETSTPRDAVAPRESGELWLPDELAPRGGWTVAPTAIPSVVSQWVRRPTPSGEFETRPVHSWRARVAAAVSAEDWGIQRVHRFARAWALLASLRRTHPDADQPCRACVRRLARAGVLAVLAAEASTRPAARRTGACVSG